MSNQSSLRRIFAMAGSLILGPLAFAQTPYNLVSTPAPAETRRPIMALLDQTPVGRTLDDWGIEIYGHIEGGYTYNFDNPSNNQNAFRLFDFQDQKAILDQIDLSIERRVDYRKNKWDVGCTAPTPA